MVLDLETRIRYYSSNCSRKLCPGGMMIGTDSHINAGGLGMLAIGVGTDAVDVMSWDGN
jgi:aconitase A